MDFLLSLLTDSLRFQHCQYKFHLIKYTDVLPAAILISFPGCIFGWRMYWISPEDCQMSATIGRLDAALILEGSQIPMPASLILILLLR